ncbi:hypothetical protein Tco_0950838 [Tanacetum coccineum]
MMRIVSPSASIGFVFLLLLDVALVAADSLVSILKLTSEDLSRNLKYVVPTGRVKVPAGRYVVPTGRVKVLAGRYVVPTGKDNVIVSAGRSKVIPAGRTILVLEVIILISLASLRLEDLSRAGPTSGIRACIWEALGGYTHDLDSFREETRQDCCFTLSGFKNMHTMPRDGVEIPCHAVKTYKRWHQNLNVLKEPRMILARTASDDITELPTSQLKKTYEEDLEYEMVMVKMPRCMSFLGSTHAYNEPICSLGMRDKVENPIPLSTPQVLPSFEECTPPVTYSEEVEMTIGTPREDDPLDQTQLEEVGLNTCSHDLFLSSREVPSVNESVPLTTALT